METSTNFLHSLMNKLPEESKWVLMQGLPYMRQAQIYDLIVQLEQDILRKIIVKKGKDSEEYKFFLKMISVLYQAGEAVNLIDRLKEEMNGLVQYNKFLHERNNRLEQDVNRFRTIEELQADGMLEAYVERTKQILKDNKPPETNGN